MRRVGPLQKGVAGLKVLRREIAITKSSPKKLQEKKAASASDLDHSIANVFVV